MSVTCSTPASLSEGPPLLMPPREEPGARYYLIIMLLVARNKLDFHLVWLVFRLYFLQVSVKHVGYKAL